MDPKIVIMSTAGTGEKYIDDNKDTASGLIDGDTCTTKDGSSAISTSNSGCYSLSFDTSSFETLFEINTAGVDSLTVFAEHFPIEFEWTTHYLISYNGKDVEPVHEWPENESQVSLGNFYLGSMAPVSNFACSDFLFLILSPMESYL